MNTLLKLAGSWALKNWHVVALALALGAGLAYIRALRAERDQAMIKKHESDARADTLKVVYQDSLETAVQKLATYSDTVTDLRKKLKDAGKAKTITHVVFTPAPKEEQHHQARGADSTFTDSVTGPPADVRASVKITASAADWSWLVRPTPIPITVNVGCKSRLNPDVILETPPWVKVDSVRTRLADNLCGEPAKAAKGSTLLRVLELGGALLVGIKIGGSL